jgi:hypothetical protein
LSRRDARDLKERCHRVDKNWESGQAWVVGDGFFEDSARLRSPITPVELGNGSGSGINVHGVQSKSVVPVTARTTYVGVIHLLCSAAHFYICCHLDTLAPLSYFYSFTITGFLDLAPFSPLYNVAFSLSPVLRLRSPRRPCSCVVSAALKLLRRLFNLLT